MTYFLSYSWMSLEFHSYTKSQLTAQKFRWICFVLYLFHIVDVNRLCEINESD